MALSHTSNPICSPLLPHLYYSLFFFFSLFHHSFGSFLPSPCAGCATHSFLHLSQECVFLASPVPICLPAHLPACLSVCLPLTVSLAVNMSAVIGICRSAHDLIQRGVLVGCLEIDLASKKWRGIKPAISVLSATLARFYPKAVGITFND